MYLCIVCVCVICLDCSVIVSIIQGDVSIRLSFSQGYCRSVCQLLLLFLEGNGDSVLVSEMYRCLVSL